MSDNQHHVDPVYRKTTKGQEAIASRAHGLVGRPRSLLILVDGHRTQSTLAALGAGFGDVAQMLAQLHGDGFVESVPAADTGTVAVAGASELKPAKAVVTLAEAKSLAARQLMLVLGPTSDALCLRIEAARNRSEFVEAIRRAYAVVADIRGRAQADAFGAMVEANLPAA
jgi:hypothetical protein